MYSATNADCLTPLDTCGSFGPHSVGGRFETREHVGSDVDDDR